MMKMQDRTGVLLICLGSEEGGSR